MKMIFCLLSCGEFEGNRLTFGARLIVEVEVCARATALAQRSHGLEVHVYHWCFQLPATIVFGHIHLTLKGSASFGLQVGWAARHMFKKFNSSSSLALCLEEIFLS
jgi:hypothetical protein